MVCLTCDTEIESLLYKDCEGMLHSGYVWVKGLPFKSAENKCQCLDELREPWLCTGVYILLELHMEEFTMSCYSQYSSDLSKK